MYQKFAVSEVRPDESNNCVHVVFTLDVDDETVNDCSIFLTDNAHTQDAELVKSKLSVDGKVVTLDVGEFKVNTVYELHVTKEISSVVGNVIDHGYKKSFVIKSPVDSTVEITSPVDYEEVESFNLKVKELPGESGRLTSSYRVQVATDVTFLDIELEQVFRDKKEIAFELAPRHQYFLRVRAENDEGDVGNWSEHRTFTKLGAEKKQSSDNVSDDDIVFEDTLQIVGYPENGVTPKTSFLLEFDDEIDPATIDVAKIMILRKVV